MHTIPTLLYFSMFMWWQIFWDYLTHPRTKWPPFRRQYFQMHFRKRKVLYFEWNFTEVYSSGSNGQKARIGLDNGSAPNRRQAIIWTNADPIHWRIYAVLGGDDSLVLMQSDRLLEFQWSNIEVYGKMHHVNLLWLDDTTTAKKLQITVGISDKEIVPVSQMLCFFIVVDSFEFYKAYTCIYSVAPFTNMV